MRQVNLICKATAVLLKYKNSKKMFNLDFVVLNQFCASILFHKIERNINNNHTHTRVREKKTLCLPLFVRSFVDKGKSIMHLRLGENQSAVSLHQGSKCSICTEIKYANFKRIN